MALSRYTFSKRTKNNTTINKSNVSYRVYQAVKSGSIRVSIKILEEGERLDQLAGLYYGDSTLWWVIAAASGIGWSPQVPPGTRLMIPTNAAEIYSVLS